MNRINSFTDLEVYKSSYELMTIVHRQILPLLPEEEKYNLKDQLNRSTKAIPRLIAEGFAKRHQVRGFQKYLYDALAEDNETIVGISQIRDLYCPPVDKVLCDDIIDRYDKVARQTYKLMQAWDSFKRADKPETNSVTNRETELTNNEQWKPKI